MAPRALSSPDLRCRGSLLPALHFEPIVLPAGAARAAVPDLATSPDDLMMIVFADGDVGDDEASAEVGRASNAWPNGARLRSLPLLPALRLTGVRDRSREELLTAAEAVLADRGLQRRFAYDTLVLGADGALSAVFWTFEPADPGCGASAGRRRWSWRSLRARPRPPPARR
jgi:hypothetical protein